MEIYLNVLEKIAECNFVDEYDNWKYFVNKIYKIFTLYIWVILLLIIQLYLMCLYSK
jgi:hypothetical protein